ncbi:MAG: AtpZ/AtpI family protein [Anaerolineaceae bacterium]|nr:AtpZ/AtpI family protein [Anaerolineaceae bacterium]
MQKKDKHGFWSSLWREAILATSLGWDLAVPIFGGTLIGYYLDRWLGTGHTFTLGLLFLGIIISYYNLWRFIRRVDRKADAEKAQEVEEEEQKENND